MGDMHRSSKWAQKLVQLPRAVKSAAVLLVDRCAIPLALCLALSVKLDQLVLPSTELLPTLLVAALSGLVALWATGFYSVVNRFAFRAPLLNISLVAVFSAVVLEACNIYLWHSRASSTAFAIYALFLVFHLRGSRLVVRA